MIRDFRVGLTPGLVTAALCAVAVHALSGCSSGSPATDRALAPVATLAADTRSTAASDSLAYEVRAVPAPEELLEVGLRVTRTGGGSEPSTAAVLIAAGDTAATLSVRVSSVERSRGTTVTVELMPGSGYTIGDDNTATVTVPAGGGSLSPEPAPPEPVQPDPESQEGAPGPAGEITFCARSPIVREGILNAVPGATADCGGSGDTTLTAAQLAAIRHLDLTRPPTRHTGLVEFRAGDFDGLTGVQELNVTDNWLPSGLRASGAPCSFLRQLRKLWYGLNAVDRIVTPHFFACLDNLEALDLRGNNIRYEPAVHDLNPEAFCRIPKLRKLAIGSNRLRTLPAAAFRCLPNLEQLDMFDMWYESAHIGFGSDPIGPDVFQGLGKLKRLDLGYNALGAAPLDAAVFDPLVSLEYLDLRDNPFLTVLPESAERLPAHVVIDVDPGVRLASEVTRAGNHPATGQPLILGTVEAGRTLSVDLSRVQDLNGVPADFSYQWRHGGRMIQHAEHATYTLDAYYARYGITVTVTFTDLAGYPEWVTSPVAGP